MSVFRRRNRRRRPLWIRAANAARATHRTAHALVKVALVLALTAALPVGLYEGYQALMASDYFVVTAIQLTGNQRLDRERVVELARLDARRNIFALDPDRLRRRLLRDPWVVDARVELQLPRTVLIDIRERQSGGWLYSGRLYRIDTTGLVIEPSSAADVDSAILTGFDPTFPEDLGAPDSTLDGRRIQAEHIRTAMTIDHIYRSQGLPRFDELSEIHYDELVGFSLLTQRLGLEVRLGHDRFVERIELFREVMEALDDRPLQGRYILLDGEGDLTRVAVGPARPGRGEL